MTDRGWRNSLLRLPSPVYFVFVVILWVTLQTVFSTEPMNAITIGIRVVGGIVFASAMTTLLVVRRRRLGGTEGLVVFGRAIRTGAVPPDADTTGWDAELDRTAAGLRRSRWFVRIGGVLPLGLGIWGLTDASSRILGGVLVVVAVAGWVVSEVWTPRALARIERVREAIAE